MPVTATIVGQPGSTPAERQRVGDFLAPPRIIVELVVLVDYKLKSTKSIGIMGRIELNSNS